MSHEGDGTRIYLLFSRHHALPGRLLAHRLQSRVSVRYSTKSWPRHRVLIMIYSRNVLIQEVKGLITTDIDKLVNGLREDFTKTTDHIMEEVKELNKIINEKENIIKTFKTEQVLFENKLQIISSRFVTIEKLSRDRNIEIQGVPEDRSENVISLFRILCNTIKYPISDRDIQACRRVAKMDGKSKRPRNVVVTLSSPRMRDEIISATYRFNKEHGDRKLNSQHLGISGETNQIYVCEHLAPDTKELFATVRHFVKNNSYAYSWVKFGQIYLRKSDKTNAILVKNEGVLKTLK
ncbi:unnamed protein product [Diatraea saccharalis]|uniref:FP protein C-terminal domain-containing protein n=1 Tax=Diatraea saccharalis TaxID=40085 RepID=A0A9N9R507_9NEOP|nr:unnamed protein product [Diatraea saccharalis]